jgi:TonB family protein
MSPAASRVAAHVVRAWYRLVTAGLSADVRDRLREEIESDLWECAHEPRLSDTRAALHMLGRVSSGAGNDLVWRLTAPRERSLLLVRASTVVVCVVVVAFVLGSRSQHFDLPDTATPMVSTLRREPPPPPPPPGVVVPALAPTYAQVSYRFDAGGPAPALTRQVRPVYPPVLQAANVRGTVVITATVTSCGRLTDLRAVRPSLLLTDAALDAVRQWTFTLPIDRMHLAARALTVTISFGA